MVLSVCLNFRSHINFLNTALEYVSSHLNMEDKTPSTGKVGLESGSPEAVLLLRSEDKGKSVKGGTKQ